MTAPADPTGPVAIDFASNWEIRGGVWRYGIELTRALVARLDPAGVIVPVYDRLPADLLAELHASGATVRSTPLTVRYDRLDSMARQQGRWIPWKTVLPFVYRPTLKERLFRSGLGGARLYHALFGCRGRPHHGTTVGTIHDLIPWLNYPDAHNGAAWMQRLIAGHRRWSTLVIVPSRATRDALVEHAEFPPERIRVVHHGIDQERFAPDAPTDEAVLHQHGLRPGKFLLYVSALAPHKNVDRMASAFLSVIGDRRDLPMILAGPTNRMTPHLAAILNDGTGRVRHIGYVDDHQLPTLYRSARALVHVALAEGFGFAPLEAMACGCAVVVSRGGASGEVVGPAGLQVDPNDADDIGRAIAQVLEDDALVEAFRARGLAQVRTFTWERCARQTLEVYQEAIALESAAPR